MGRRRGIMSDRFKEELAKELGFYDVVQKEGWGGIKAKDAGNMVKRAIELAEQQLMNKQQIPKSSFTRNLNKSALSFSSYLIQSNISFTARDQG